MSPTEMPTEVVKLLKEFRQELRDMRAAMEKDLRKEFKELKRSVDFFSTQFDTMATRSSKIEKENAALKKENAALLAECNSLKKMATAHEQRITDIEQYSRNRNVEVKGIPEIANEKLPDILKRLGDVVSEDISEADIDACHRVPRKDGGCANVVVQFRSRTKRDAFIEKARKKRVCTTHLGFPDRSNVYVNDHLCPTLKKLLGQVIARKNEKQWKYAWTRGGKIFARKTDTSRTLRLTCPQDLEKME